WMAMLAPGAMSPKEQASVWLGGVPLIAQLPGPVYAGLSDQSTSVPAGSGSLSFTLTAVPVLVALLFDTTILKPIGSPAATEAASATLVTLRPGGIMVASSEATSHVPDAGSTAGLFFELPA